ncbi:hypothetical protein [Paenibacillus sp. 1P03SA]|uniref:hypothetical protein n=1 Tax=Paenibacillus sp. 1P03SA TaxID=3132294 RepID=UPI00399F19A3
MKVNKTLLVGIGIGMITGSALLQLMLSAARPVQPLSQNSAVSIEQMDMNKLKTEAGKYYQVFDKNQPVFTKEQHEQETAEAAWRRRKRKRHPFSSPLLRRSRK